eukprot:9136-Heterococcus_DN1.PRE.1
MDDLFDSICGGAKFSQKKHGAQQAAFRPKAGSKSIGVARAGAFIDFFGSRAPAGGAATAGVGAGAGKKRKRTGSIDKQ